MGGLSIWHWLIVGILVLLLFGKGRFSDMMGDVAKGIKSFKGFVRKLKSGILHFRYKKIVCLSAKYLWQGWQWKTRYGPDCALARICNEQPGRHPNYL